MKVFLQQPLIRWRVHTIIVSLRRSIVTVRVIMRIYRSVNRIRPKFSDGGSTSR